MRKGFAVIALSFVFVSSFALAQNCRPPELSINPNSGNIFSPEQEINLGDAIFERFQKDYRVIDDAKINEYLQVIGERLEKHLPPTNIKYRYAIADLADTNAYAIAGGRIFVTRKLISFVRNEDELAGVIAHELGHATVRDSAIDMSVYFKQVLGVTQVGSRRDIFDKYNQLLENWRTKRIKFSNNQQDEQQLEADKIGMYAMIAAGYDPNIYTKFWSRFTEAKKINFFTALFGKERQVDKRLKEMIDAFRMLPQDCFEKKDSKLSETFERWKNDVISFSGLGEKESFAGMISRTSLVPLRSDIDSLRFSPNGEYILAQDSSSIAVIKKEPFSVLFRFDAYDAMPADFTNDSKYIIVHNKNLRVQKWDIAEKRLVSIYEVAVPKGFWQSNLSPDGSILATYQFNGDLVLYDVATNEVVFTEKNFYVPDFIELFLWNLTLELLDLSEISVVNMKFSPDGKLFLAGRKNTQMFGFTNQETIAVDLTVKKPISIGDNVKKLLFTSFTFLGPDKIVGQFGSDIDKSGIFSFPDGKRLDQFELGGNEFQKSKDSDFLLVRPVIGAAVGVYDLKAKKYIVANKKSAMDVFQDKYVAERKNGELALYQMDKNEPYATLQLPPSTFGNLRTASISADGAWLAVSDRSRGAVWNLKTGERKLHTRGFRGSYFGESGKVFADFPKQDNTERTIAVMDMNLGSIAPGYAVPPKSNTRQYGRFLITRKSKNEKPEKVLKKDERPAYTEEERTRAIGFKNIVFEVRDAQNGALLWTKDFEDETPAYFMSPAQNIITFVWGLETQAANSIISTFPEMSEKVRGMQNKEGDYLLQFIDASTGVNKGNFLLETGEGSFKVENVFVVNDYVVVTDDENRILVYSAKSERIVQRFFGEWATVSPSGDMIAISNVPGRVTIYDLKTGDELSRLSFLKPLSMLQFLPDGKRLFVLTADQTAFFFEPSKAKSAQINVTQ